MRTFQNNALSIEYPDTLVMAFDAVAINLTALNASENPSYKMTAVITDTDANKSLTDSRTAHDGLMSFDLAGYVRALMAPHMDEPFKADADGYLPVTRDFSVELLWAGSASVLTFAFTAVWGSLPIGGTFNPSRSVKIWQGKPNILALFGHSGTKLNGQVVFNGTKLLPLPSTAQSDCYFAVPSTSPWIWCNRSEDYRTLESSINAGTLFYNKSFTDAPMTFDSDGNYLILNTNSVQGINHGIMAIKAPAGKKIVSWTMDVAVLLNTSSVGIITSNGAEYGIDENQGATIKVEGLDCAEDTFTIISNAPSSDNPAMLQIDLVDVTLEDVGTGEVTEQTISIKDDLKFLTYQRTGTMTLQGTGREVQVKTIMQCGSDGVFLRWIDGQGFPVSWLFQKGSEQRKVTASSAYRANMKDGLYVNDGNAQQLQIDTKDAKVTQDIAASLVTAEEYDTLRSILTSPVVELWDGERWQRVNVSAGTDKRSTAVKQQFEFSIIMPEEVAQQL